VRWRPSGATIGLAYLPSALRCGLALARQGKAPVGQFHGPRGTPCRRAMARLRVWRPLCFRQGSRGPLSMRIAAEISGNALRRSKKSIVRTLHSCVQRQLRSIRS